MESEKVKEIKKALECCANWNGQESCKDCPIGLEKCLEDQNLMSQLALTLINELESENERLLEQRNKTYDIWVRDTEKLRDRIAELEKENAKLLDSVETVQSNRCTTKCELTKRALKQFGKKLELNIGKHLKKKHSDYQQDSFYYIVDKADVDMCLDETLKEFINE